MIGAEDLGNFFNLDDFAEEATLTPPTGTARPIQVIYDETQGGDSVTGYPQYSPDFFITAQTADLVGVGTEDSTLVLRGETYLIVYPQADGTGTSRVILRKLR